jgi:hypothetical protein
MNYKEEKKRIMLQLSSQEVHLLLVIPLGVYQHQNVIHHKNHKRVKEKPLSKQSKEIPQNPLIFHTLCMKPLEQTQSL